MAEIYQNIAYSAGAALLDLKRFLQVFEDYKENPDVTKRRMYLETMQNLLSGVDKVIMDRGIQSSVVPYLPLNELRRGSAGGRSSGAAQ